MAKQMRAVPAFAVAAMGMLHARPRCTVTATGPTRIGKPRARCYSRLNKDMGIARRIRGGTAMKLTQQQIDDFNREGWLFLPELFSREEVALLAHEAEGIYDTDRPEVWREKSGAPRTAFAAHLY